MECVPMHPHALCMLLIIYLLAFFLGIIDQVIAVCVKVQCTHIPLYACTHSTVIIRLDGC